MRLWHKDLIPYLPRQQLLGQWRECCLIAKNITEKGTPNHILINPIMDYPIEHFISYTCLVLKEMEDRGYCAVSNAFRKYFNDPKLYINTLMRKKIFPDWHTDRYLEQCLMNLEEKHDRGGITDDEWIYILENVKK